MRERHIGATALHPESLMMGYAYDPRLSEGAIKTPLFLTSTFVFESAEEGKAFFELAYGLRQPNPGEEQGLIYSRLNNPDLQVVEERLTLWDGAEEGALFASGMAAIATSLLAVLRPGDVVVHSDPLYGGSEYLLNVVLPRFEITALPFAAGVPFADIEADLRARLDGRRVGAILIETPANPTNALVDIGAVAAFGRSLERDGQRPVFMVDNTFLGPVFQHPLQHGADLVIYSATKFIGGHSDLIAGAVLGSREQMAPVRALRTFLGTMAGPHTGWLISRSLETLKMRMTAQMKNARYVAAFLDEHPKVSRVHYLGLLSEGDPMFSLYRRQCHAPGSIVAFDIEGGEAAAFRFLNALSLFRLAVSLGGTESLAEHPGTMTHADVNAEDQRRMGITPGLVRLSVGVEHYEDLLADIAAALERA